MDHILAHLKEDYLRIKSQIGQDPFEPLGLITYDDVLRAHYLMVNYFADEEGASIYGVKDLNLLGSALGRQITEYGGFKKYDGVLEQVATLFYGLVMNHAFHDGNKRTALLILIYNLTKNNFQFRDNCNKAKLEELAVNIAANNLKFYGRYKRFVDKEDPEVNLIIDFLSHNTRKSDKRFYPVTFWEFNALLKRFNCYLDHPSGNRINIYQEVEKKLPLLKPYKKTVKILQVGFPGWKKAINQKAAKEILKKAGLNSEHGIDSQVFYKGSDPMSYLIDYYNEPLRRLKDR